MDRRYEQMASHDRHGSPERLALEADNMHLQILLNDLQRLLICYPNIAGDLDQTRMAHTARSYLLSEFLVHAADVEGLCKGIDEELVASEYEIRSSTYEFTNHLVQNSASG